MIETFLGKTAGFSEYSPYAVAQATIVSFNTFRMFLPESRITSLKCNNKTIPNYRCKSPQKRCLFRLAVRFIFGQS
jgi:hypothetical protein